MINSIYKIIIAILTITTSYFFIQTQVLKNRAEELKIEVDKEVARKAIDAVADKTKLIKEYNKRFDSILNKPPIYKWRRYEKLIYVNRSLDDALSIIARYNYSKTERKDTANIYSK